MRRPYPPDNRRFIKQSDIDRAFVKVGIGAEKRSKVISEKDKKITAYHEAGHAILFHVLRTWDRCTLWCPLSPRESGQPVTPCPCLKG